MTGSPQPASALSAYAPFSRPEVGDTAWWIALGSSLDLRRVWFGQQSFTPVTAGVGYAAGRGHRSAVGSAVTLMPTTTPFSAAQELRALARLSGEKVTACFSPGYPAIQAMHTGRTWRSPLTATREYLAALRGLLSGGPVDVRGEYVTTVDVARGSDVSGDVELGLGVLRPALTRLAGEIADAAVTWLATPDYLAGTLLPALSDGADGAGRRRPRMVATLHAAPGIDAEQAPEVIRRAIGPHLSAPHYRDALHRAGLRIPESPTDDNLRELAAQGLFALGDPDDVLARVGSLREAGADEVAIVLHHPPTATLDDVRARWTELAAPQPVGGAA